jgi:hypothetical protein
MAMDAPLGVRSLAGRDRSTVDRCQPRVASSQWARGMSARALEGPSLWREGDIQQSRRGERQTAVRQGVSKRRPVYWSNRGWPIGDPTRGFVRLAWRPVHVTKASSHKAVNGQAGERHGVTRHSDGKSTRARAMRPGRLPGPLLEQFRLRPDHDAVALRSV